MNRWHGWFFSVLVWSTALVCRAADFDVEARFINVNGKDLTGIPVFVPVKSLFGRGIDFRQLDRNGFHIYGRHGREIPFMYRPLPPYFSIANDELIFFLDDFPSGAKSRYRFTNDRRSSSVSKQIPLDMQRLAHHRHNWVPNGGFEQESDRWAGGKIVTDMSHSGRRALLLRAQNNAESVGVRLNKSFQFKPEGRYYFSLWAKSQNVARSGYRWQDAGGRILLAGDPFRGGLPKIQDTRDWYCYKPTFAGVAYTRGKWRQESATFKLKGHRQWVAGKEQVSAIYSAGYKSKLSFHLTQKHLPYINPKQPARVWIDDILLFDQPQIIFDFDRVAKKSQLTGPFAYSRPVTMTEGGILNYAPRPTPWEKVDRLVLEAARGERKVVPLGISLPGGGKGIFVDRTDLVGAGRLRPSEVEYQIVKWHDIRWGDKEYWVYDLHRPIDASEPCHIDFFVAYDIPPQAKPGTYRGAIDVKIGRTVVGSIPIELTVQGFSLKVITDRYIGAIFNRGMGHDAGAQMPPQSRAFFKYYRRSNFPYIMFFSNFLPFKGQGPEVDIARLVNEMRFMKKMGLSAGVGLYWDCALDRFGRNGLWPRSGKNPERYRQEVVKMDHALSEAGLGRLVYMIWDEPSSPSAVTDAFGLLKGTGAVTTCDAMGWAFYKTLRYISHTSCDDPAQEMGPAVYEYCHRQRRKFGLCGTAWNPKTSRYQVGMMIAAADMHYWHQWHILNFYGQTPDRHQFVRNRSAINFGEGIIDLRYHDTLVDVIAHARNTGRGLAQADAAQAYLNDILGFCNGDQDQQATFYNGTPSDWGDDRFYDHWRRKMGRHIVAILQETGPLPGKRGALGTRDQ